MFDATSQLEVTQMVPVKNIYKQTVVIRWLMGSSKLHCANLHLMVSCSHIMHAKKNLLYHIPLYVKNRICGKGYKLFPSLNFHSEHEIGNLQQIN
jgi:hypothetical protein